MQYQVNKLSKQGSRNKILLLTLTLTEYKDKVSWKVFFVFKFFWKLLVYLLEYLSYVHLEFTFSLKTEKTGDA